MTLFYSDLYTIPLPEGHRFPMEKYRLLREALTERGLFTEEEIRPAVPATEEQLLLAHTPAYVRSILDGTAAPAVMRRIGFPWSPALARRSMITVGGALCAADEALRSGVSANLAGGTHHAMRNEGEGFCVFNDQAVTALRLLSGGRVRRVAVVDLDVHQGNGTAEILGGRDDVFILSMHGAKNFPFRKVPSTLDVELADGTGDGEYLSALASALPLVFAFRPDIVLYQMGVDVLKEDALGRLHLSLDGIAAREQMVYGACRRHGVPVSVALGGGYAKPIAHTIEAQLRSFAVLRSVFG